VTVPDGLAFMICYANQSVLLAYHTIEKILDYSTPGWRVTNNSGLMANH